MTVMPQRPGPKPATIPASSPWTPEREARLRELWRAGKSAGFIVTDLDCGITRNAVIGKIGRLGLPQRRTTERLRPEGRKPRKSRAKPPRTPETVRQGPGTPEPVPPVQPTPQARQTAIALVPDTAVTFRDITDHQCHYIIGDPKGLDTLYCGGEIHARSLCVYHYHLCWHQHYPNKPAKLWRVA